MHDRPDGTGGGSRREQAYLRTDPLARFRGERFADRPERAIVDAVAELDDHRLHGRWPAGRPFGWESMPRSRRPREFCRPPPAPTRRRVTAVLGPPHADPRVIGAEYDEPARSPSWSARFRVVAVKAGPELLEQQVRDGPADSTLRPEPC